jgi:hypothetical protein
VNHPLDALFDQFLKERRYLKNVTEATLVWYRVAFSNYTSFVADDHAPLPTKASLQGSSCRCGIAASSRSPATPTSAR